MFSWRLALGLSSSCIILTVKTCWQPSGQTSSQMRTNYWCIKSCQSWRTSFSHISRCNSIVSREDLPLQWTEAIEKFQFNFDSAKCATAVFCPAGSVIRQILLNFAKKNKITLTPGLQVIHVFLSEQHSTEDTPLHQIFGINGQYEALQSFKSETHFGVVQ